MTDEDSRWLSDEVSLSNFSEAFRPEASGIRNDAPVYGRESNGEK